MADLGGYRFRCRTNGKLADLQVPGGALLIDAGDGEFICIGRNLIFTFAPLDGAALTAELVALDVGTYTDGQWRHGRRLNGDETAHGTGVLLGTGLVVCRFRLFACGTSQTETRGS